MKKVMLFLAAFLMLLSPLAAAGQLMSVTWEWLLDDPEVNYYRYQLDGEVEDAWTVVDGTVSSYTVDGLDPYSNYTLYLQRSYDGVFWSESAEAVAEALLVEDIPESADITPVLEEPVVEETVAPEEVVPVIAPVVEEEENETAAPVEEVVEEVEEVLVEPLVEVAPVLEPPFVSVKEEVAPAYVAEAPVEEEIIAIGEEIIVNADLPIEEEEKVLSVEDIVVIAEPEEAALVAESTEPVELVEEEVAPVAESTEPIELVEEEVEEPVVEEEVVEEVAPVEEVVEEVPAEEPVVEEEVVVVEEEPVEEVLPVEAPVEKAEKESTFKFSLLLKGGFDVNLDFKDGETYTPAPTATIGFDFANIVGNNTIGLGIRWDVGLAFAPNESGWTARFADYRHLFDFTKYCYMLDTALYVTTDLRLGIVDFTLGAGFSGGIMFPNSVKYNKYAYNDAFTMGGQEYHYKLAPAALLGMRVYAGDVFSIGLEGVYRAAIGDWMHHDVLANLVLGFTF